MIDTHDTYSKIKPIETEYNGYRFRSRLEARWAIFFDELNLNWEYETEGYDIFGIWYLPDFYIKQYDCFVEIKPEPTNNSIYGDFRSHTGKHIILLCGSPWDYIGMWFGWDTCDSGGGESEYECIIVCPMALIVNIDRTDRDVFVSSDYKTNPNVLESHAYNTTDFPWDWDECKKYASFRTKEATAKSKRARFEHG